MNSPGLLCYDASGVSKGREVRSFDYVDHPYERVREILSTDAMTVAKEIAVTVNDVTERAFLVRPT